MRGFDFWQKWLLIASVLIVLGGLSMAFLNQSYLFKLFFTNRVNSAFWASPDVAEQVVLFERWAYGVFGAMMAGWGVFMTFVARGPFKNKERWAWNCFVYSLGLWFIVDVALSAYFAVYINVIVDILIFALFAIPLFQTRKDF